MSSHAPRSTVPQPEVAESSEVQRAQIKARADAKRLRDAYIKLLENELEVPRDPALVGGSMCWWHHEIREPIIALRHTEIERILERKNHTYELADVKEAAWLVFEAVQDSLFAFEGTDHAVPDRVFLWRLQSLAKNTLLEFFGHNPSVRAIQVDAAGLTPLTVCFGHRERAAVEVVAGVRNLPGIKRVPRKEIRARAWQSIARGELLILPGELYSFGDGCGRVHRESESPEKLFKRYCDRCATDSGNKQRKLERSFWTEKQARSDGRGLAECVCGEMFESTRANQKRCLDCRRAHRVRVRNAETEAE